MIGHAERKIGDFPGKKREEDEGSSVQARWESGGARAAAWEDSQTVISLVTGQPTMGIDTLMPADRTNCRRRRGRRRAVQRNGMSLPACLLQLLISTLHFPHCSRSTGKPPGQRRCYPWPADSRIALPGRDGAFQRETIASPSANPQRAKPRRGSRARPLCVYDCVYVRVCPAASAVHCSRFFQPWPPLPVAMSRRGVEPVG